MEGGRTVTLVVVDGDGDVLGQLPAFEVRTPWWSDVEPVVAAHPDLTVLRLLRVEPAARQPMADMGGHVTYVAEAVHPPSGLVPTIHAEAAAADHPLRMPWARPGGPAADLAWVAAHAEITGAPSQVRSWNLSAIWRIPTATGVCWLKCVPPFFAHEASVIAALGPSPSLPDVVAADGSRMLMAEMAGQDGYGAARDRYLDLLEILVGLQVAALASPAPAQAAPANPTAPDAPDWRPGPFGTKAAALVERLAPEWRGLRRLLDEWDERWAAVGECGVPDALFHGDLHPGNARLGVAPPVIFDWGDSGWGHPLLDLGVLDRADPDDAAGLRRDWLGLWRRAVPGCDPDRAWRLLEPMVALRPALVYQAFLDQIEQSEHPYHRADVQPHLVHAERLMTA